VGIINGVPILNVAISLKLIIFEKRNFSKIIIYLTYSFLFFIIWGHSPFIVTDTLEGIIKNPINISSIKRNTGNHEGFTLIRNNHPPVLVAKTHNNSYPILMSNRHSGLILTPYKLLNEYLKYPEKLYIIWHFIFGLLQVFLLELFVRKKFSNSRISFISTMFFAINPLTVMSYAFFITEIVTINFYLLTLNILESKKKMRYREFTMGLLLSLGFWSRVNFVWLAATLIPTIKKLKNKEIFKICIIGFLITLPYLYIIDYQGLSRNMREIYGSSGNMLTSLFHFVSLFFMSSESASFLWNDNFYNIINSMGLKYFLGNYFLWISFCISIYWVIISDKKTKKMILENIITLLIFLSAMIISLGRLTTYANYIYPISIWSSLFFGIICEDMLKKGNKGKILATFLLIPLIINIFTSYENIYKNGPVSWHDMNIAKQVMSKIKDKKVYLLGESDIGKYDYLSNGEFRPTYLFREISDGKYKSLGDVLEKKGKGTIAIPLKDEWSGWYIVWGEIKPSEVKRLSKFYNINITNEIFINKRGRTLYWIFDFSTKDQEAHE
jgi:hypothetical protein